MDDGWSVVRVHAVEFRFELGCDVGVRREWMNDELVDERAVLLDEAVPRELHPVVREVLDGVDA